MTVIFKGKTRIFKNIVEHSKHSIITEQWLTCKKCVIQHNNFKPITMMVVFEHGLE
jgi:hypothetical protein